MEAKQPYIVYTLPKTRTTQAITGGKTQKAWSNVQHFLANCTTAEIEAPRSIQLTAYTASGEWNQLPGPADAILEKAKNTFGPGTTSPVSYHYPDNTPSKQTSTRWELTSDDLTGAIDYMIAGQPYPKYALGPLQLIISYTFKLTYPGVKQELPNQQVESHLLVWLSKTYSVSPTLCFPFTGPDDEFWNYAESIMPFIPFKFDSKDLRLARPNKKGSYTFSKLDSSGV